MKLYTNNYYAMNYCLVVLCLNDEKCNHSFTFYIYFITFNSNCSVLIETPIMFPPQVDMSANKPRCPPIKCKK